MNEVLDSTAEIKVRALSTGYYANVRMRGDDTLGAGNGDVFILEPRHISEFDLRSQRPILDKDTGKVKMRLLTAEEQFSSNWMEKVSSDEEERHTFAQSAIDIQNNRIAESKRPKRARA